MKRFYLFLALPLFFVSCGFSECSTKNNKPETWESGDPPLPIDIETQVKVVNNTDSAITIFEAGQFFYNPENGVSLYEENSKILYTSSGENTTGAFKFKWTPGGGRIIGLPNTYAPGDTLPPSAQEIRKKFEPVLPEISSFFLRMRIDNEDYILAGWPEAYDSAGFFKNDKIVQYNIGYSKGTEVRIGTYKNGRKDFWGRKEYAYFPFVVTCEDITSDFDNYFITKSSNLFAESVLTIDGPDKIKFEPGPVLARLQPGAGEWPENYYEWGLQEREEWFLSLPLLSPDDLKNMQ